MLIIFGMSNIRSSRNGSSSSTGDKRRTAAARLDQRRCSTKLSPCWELRPFQRECRGRVQQPITQWLGWCYDRCAFCHLPNYHSVFQPALIYAKATHSVAYACGYKWVPRVFFMAHFPWRNAASECIFFFLPMHILPLLCVLLMARFE